MAFLTQGSIQLGVDTFEEFIPRRFALKFNPPTIVLEYFLPSNGKLYMHNMRIKPEDLLESPKQLYTKLRKKHINYLDPGKVSKRQIKDLILQLQRVCIGR